MSKTITAVVAIFFISIFIAKGQRIETNEIDDFTGVKNTISSWETISMANGAPLYARIWKLSEGDVEVYAIDLKINNVPIMTTIDKDAEIIFLFSGGGRVTLKAHEGAISNRGLGVIARANISQVNGINPKYPFETPNADFKTFQEQVVDRFRIYYSQGYVDYTVNNRQSRTIQNLFKLFDL